MNAGHDGADELAARDAVLCSFKLEPGSRQFKRLRALDIDANLLARFLCAAVGVSHPHELAERRARTALTRLAGAARDRSAALLRVMGVSDERVIAYLSEWVTTKTIEAEWVRIPLPPIVNDPAAVLVTRLKRWINKRW